jgi:hypothetical protein
VTVADLGLLNIGAAFWGLLAGMAVSWLLEKPDFAALADTDRRAGREAAALDRARQARQRPPST